MNVSVDADEEVSNLEAISATGTFMSDELLFDITDNVRPSVHYYFHHDKWKKPLKQSFYIGILCYVFCCPPVPEMITRKLAFHPLSRGRTYLVRGKDAHGNFVRTNNAKKASKFTSLEFEAQNLTEGSSVPMEGVEIAIIRTRRSSYLPILRINSLIYESNDESKDLVVLFSQPNSSDLGCYFQPHGINFSDIELSTLKLEIFAAEKSNVQLIFCAEIFSYVAYVAYINPDVRIYKSYENLGISLTCCKQICMPMIIPDMALALVAHQKKNIYADIEAVYKYISESQGPHVRIALLGYSIGTAPTVYIASKHPPNLCGIVLVAPFASGLRLCAKVERTWCMDRFLSYDRAAEVNVPVLICHGDMDSVIPKSHSEILVEQFPRAVEPFFVEHANHLTIFSGHFPSVFIRIRHFLYHETDLLQHAIMYARKLLIIIIKLATIIVGQVWHPCETYDSFYDPYSYQGFGYDGGCADIIMTDVPCQRFLGQWNLYPDYQLQNYNTKSYMIGPPNMIVPYDNDNVISQTPEIPMNLLDRGILLDNAEMTTISSHTLAAKFVGANILNDKNKFMARGCSYDASHNRCVDSLNFCQENAKTLVTI
ncbi:hypothetical protein DINM_006007 [Dirofilaria immitis]|nr:hypothetical protein [Dirofilaria immitis]